jgi:protein dithiol:quinone oxidoreductase
MKSRNLLFLIAAACIGFLAFAVYLQHVKGVDACPLCILQRYAFVLLAIFCLVGGFANLPRTSAFFGFLTTLSGGGVAVWQLWLATQVGVDCGFDPIETVVNQLITAKWLPFLFYGEGSCTADNFRLFGFSAPQWALFWFVTFALALVWIMFRRGRR